MKHIVCFSGGKDSTAMLLKMLEMNMQVDEIIFVKIKATQEIDAEFPEMYEYVEKINQYIKKNYDKNITILEQEKSFEDYFYQVKEKGKNKGKIYGFPHTIKAWCNDRLKLKVFRDYLKKQENCCFYLGIAADEKDRIKRQKENIKMPLVEWGMTEKDCLEYLKEKKLENPLYQKFHRLGCWFCPKQSLDSLRILRRDYKALWNKLMEWQKDSETSFKINYTVQELEEKFKKEELLNE